MTAGNLRVVAGEHSLSQYSGAEQISAVVSFVANTAYDPNTLVNDIAIIKVSTSLPTLFLNKFQRRMVSSSSRLIWNNAYCLF